MKTAEAPIEIPHYFLETRDAVRLRYFDTGADIVGARQTRRAFLLANGLGGPVSAFRPYLARWAGRYRLLSWDYRGLYGSKLPLGPPPDLSVLAHVDDVIALLDRAEVESVDFLGWSMGVQIALELCKRHPQRVNSLVLVSGTAGRPLAGVALPFAEKWLGSIVRRARSHASLGSAVLEGASRVPSTARWLKRIGALAQEFDEQLFHDMLRGFKTVDLAHYFELLEELCRHDAHDVLEQLRVPTLVVNGSRDRLTPEARARAMAERIRGSEFFAVPLATHYAAAEFPGLIAERVEDFITRRTS